MIPRPSFCHNCRSTAFGQNVMPVLTKNTTAWKVNMAKVPSHAVLP